MNLIELLIEKKLTISTMESCTSGLVASMITDTEGSSAVFKGGIITYTNEEKEHFGVDSSVIEKFGVYSLECAKEMARAAQNYFKTDISIGVTGTTGNLDPNNSDSVKGVAFFAARIFDEERAFKIEEDVSKMQRSEIKRMYAERILSSLLNVLSN